MATPIRTASFRLLLSAAAVSNLADGISALALPWIASLITRDPTLIALVAFATRLPWFLFAIPAGVITDWADRRLLMVRSDLARLALSLGVLWMAATLTQDTAAGPAIAALSLLAFGLGCAEVLRDNAAQTVLPSITGKDVLERANGQLWTLEQIMGSFIGPPLAGLLIALAVPAPFALNALGFAAAAFLIWRLRIPPRAPVQRRPVRTEMNEGWDWMRAHPTILRLAVMLGILNAVVIMALTMLVLFSQEVLSLGAAGYGLLMTASAAGGVVGGILGPRVVVRLGARGAVRLALGLFPLPFIAIALTSSVWIVAAALFTEMFAGLLWNIVTVSYRQRRIPDTLLGRVNSLYRFFGWGMMPLGALAGGWIVSLAEPQLGRALALRLPYAGAALGCGALAGYGWIRLRLPP